MAATNAPLKSAGLTVPPPPLNFSIPPPSAAKIETVEPTLSASKSLTNLGSLISNQPPQQASINSAMQRPSSATLSQPPPTISTSNFSVPPPQLNAPPPNLSALPPKLSAPPPNLNAPPPNLHAPPLNLNGPPPNFAGGPTTSSTIDLSIPPPNIVMKAAAAVAGAVTNCLMNQPSMGIPNLKHPPPTSGLYSTPPPDLPQQLKNNSSRKPVPLINLEQNKFGRNNNPIRSLASTITSKPLNRVNPKMNAPKNSTVIKQENLIQTNTINANTTTIQVNTTTIIQQTANNDSETLNNSVEKISML